VKKARKVYSDFLAEYGSSHDAQLLALRKAIASVESSTPPVKSKGGKGKKKWTAADLKNNEPIWVEKYKASFIKNPAGGWSRVSTEPPKGK
jgi:hypothetical protein